MKNESWGSNPLILIETLEWKLPVQPLSFLHDTCQIDMYLYVQIDTRDRNSNFYQKHENNNTRRRETMRARPRPPSAESGETSKVRHVEQTKHRMMDLISS